MTPQQREALRLESASLREDVRHLTSRVAFIDEWSDASRVGRELADLKRKIDALEAYANVIVNVHETGPIKRVELENEIERKEARLSQIRGLALAKDTSRVHDSKPRHISNPRRVGILSEEKTLELCANLGMTIDELRKLVEKGS